MAFFHILTGMTAIVVLASGAFGKIPAESKEGAISCALTHFCKCGNGKRTTACLKKIQPQTRREMISWANEVCEFSKEAEDDLEDFKEKLCGLGPENQKTCVDILADRGIAYINACSADPLRKNETVKIEDSRVCFSAMMGWCSLGTC